MADIFKNFAYCALTSSVNNSTTTFPVDETGRIPDPTTGEVWLTVESTLAAGAFEIVRVTARSVSSGAGNLTVVRGQDGTTAVSHSSGDVLKGSVTAGMLTRLAQMTAKPLFSDDFNRADGAVGNGWTTLYGTAPVLAGNKVTNPTAGGALSRSIPADFDVTFDYVPPSAGGSVIAVYFRFAANVQDGYYLNGTSSELKIYKRVSNSDTAIITGTTQSDRSGTWRFTVIGSSINVYRNGTSVLSGDLGTNNPNSQTYFAIDSAYQASGTAFTFDNFSLYYPATNILNVPSSDLLSRPQGTFARRYSFDSSTEGWSVTGGTATQTNGRLQLTGGGSNFCISLEPSTVTSVANGEFYADLYPTTAGAGAAANLDDSLLFFRATDTSNFYAVELYTGTYSASALPEVGLLKVVSGSWTSLGQTPLVSSGYLNQPIVISSPTAGPFRIMVRFVGSLIQVFVNEVLVIQTKDTTYTTGRVGAGVGISSYVTQFDNVTLYTLPSTWTPTNYSSSSGST